MNKKILLGILLMALTISLYLIPISDSLIAEEADTLASVDSVESAPVTKKIAELNFERCIKCGLCAAICPEGSITMVKHKPVIDPEKCIGCEVCVLKCPTKALKMTDYIVEEKEEISDSTKTDEVEEEQK